MIRYINLDNQVTDGEKEFAFFDTVTGNFLEFAGAQTWSDRKDFEDCFRNDPNSGRYRLGRFVSLIPGSLRRHKEHTDLKLAHAYDIIYGEVTLSRPISVKAQRMEDIIKGDVTPGIPFSKWSKLFQYLQAQ